MFDGARIHRNLNLGRITDDVQLVDLFFNHHESFHLLQLMLNIVIECWKHVIDKFARMLRLRDSHASATRFAWLVDRFAVVIIVFSIF